MENQIAKVEEKVAGLDNYTDAQIALIKRTVAKGATNDELVMFVHTANKTGLDPFLKEIYFIKHGNGAVVMMTGRDGFLKIAHKSGKFRGMNSGCVRKNDEFEVDYGEDTEVVHKIKTLDPAERGAITGAWAEVFKEGNDKPVVVVVEWGTYNKKQNTWASHPDAMIIKVAESIALKKCFGTSGLVSVEEMGFDAKKDEENTDKDYSIWNAMLKKVDELIKKGDLDKALNIVNREMEENKNLDDIGKGILKEYIALIEDGKPLGSAKPLDEDKTPEKPPQEAPEAIDGKVEEQVEQVEGEEITVEACEEMMDETEKPNKT